MCQCGKTRSVLKARLGTAPTVLGVEWTHRHYIKDDEYIAFDERSDPNTYIPEFLKREIARPIVRWEDGGQLGYEFLPNKYFYRHEEPKASDEFLADFWRLEREAERLLAGLGGK